jgi:MFS superfamily sulfate permease-like transporter
VRPFTVLLGIVMGSAVSIFVGLAATLVVYLLLGAEYHERLAAERAPLLGAVGWAALLVAASVAAFTGEIKRRGWRRWAQLALAVVLAAFIAAYWPY